MASHNLFVLATIALALFVCHCQADLIDDVCRRAGNDADVEDCFDALRSDPRSKGADLKGLVDIVADQSIAAVEVASKAAKSVAITPKTKNLVATCIKTLNGAIGDLKKSKTSLKNGGKETGKTQASAASTEVQTCSDQVSGSPGTGELQTAADHAQDLIFVLLHLVAQL